MKRILAFFTVIFTMLSLSAFSQTNGTINGSAADGNAKAIESATVTLLKSKDSSLIKTSASDKAGNFAFDNIADGKYLVSVSAVAFKTAYSNSFEITAANSAVTLKTIQLIPQAKSLASVTVTAKKALFEQKAGMTVVNVDAAPTNIGTNALELLEKSPGVSVDNDGNISLKGKQGVLILLDGKPTYMSATDLAAYLKNMQSSNIDQIEIMTNPPAKYDAAGNSGIINIKTKKGNIKGMNGTANAGYSQAYYSRFNGSVNLNYRNNKLNLFGGYNGGTYEGYNNLIINRKFYTADKTLTGTGDQLSHTHFKGNYQSFKAGMDYYFSKKDVAGFVVNGNFGDNQQNPFTNSNVRDASEDILYKLRSNSNNSSLYTNISANANYKHTFDSAGREISADLDYAYYNTKSNNDLNTQSFDANDIKDGKPVILTGHIPSDIKIYSAKVDYIHPFKSGLRLESGLKTSYVNTDNQVTYLRDNGNGVTMDDRSNHFVYNENINAAYAIFSKKMKKWDMTAGLRLENTISDGHQLKNDSTFKRNYTNLFPNVGLGFTANDKNQINLSYSRRIARPDYEDLNPFIYFIDSLTYGQGNPYLQPQFSNNFELSHTYNKFLTTTVNYTQTNDIMTQLLKQDAEKKTTYQTMENLSSMKQFGVSVSINAPIKKWYNINLYTNVFNNRYKGIYGADPIDVKATGFTGNMTNSFTMGKGWSAEVSGWFRSKGAEGLLIVNKMGALNSAISKQVLKKQGTIKIGIRDILSTQQFSGYAKYSVVNVDLAGHRDSRQFNVSFTYRFGKTNIPSERRKTGGADDEQSRVKSGGN